MKVFWVLGSREPAKVSLLLLVTEWLKITILLFVFLYLFTNIHELKSHKICGLGVCIVHGVGQVSSRGIEKN